MAADPAGADDGAMFAFWAFVERRRRVGRLFDPENLEELREAVAAFDAGED